MNSVDILGFVLVFVSLGIHGLQGANVYGNEGGAVVLECDINYDPRLNLFWQTVESSGFDLQILLKKIDGTIEYFPGPWNGRVDLVNGKDLRIPSVSRDDDSDRASVKYRCSQPTGGVGGSHTLHVRYPPSSISVTGYNSSFPLQPRDELQLSCTASDSNPEPHYAWHRNGPKIEDGNTLTINPIKLENNGDIITCKVTQHDGNDPVYDWEGEGERIILSVTDDEPGDDTTVGGSGNGVNVGLAVGLSVAVVVAIVIIALLGVFIRRNRPPTPVSGEDGHCSTGNGEIDHEMSQLPPSHQNGTITSGAQDEIVDSEDGPSGSATGEFGIEHEGPPIAPGDHAEPEPSGGPVTEESAQDGTSEQPHTQSTQPSNGADGGSLPFPVIESTGAGRPTQPESTSGASSTIWPDIYDIVESNLRSKYRSSLARALGLGETDISNIEEDYHLRAREKLHQVLLLWRERNPTATPETLAIALRSCRCNAVANLVEELWLGHNRR